MKHTILIFAALFLFSANIHAQYEPTTTWPYIYPDFVFGELQKYKSGPVQGVYNIHLLHGTLHFIEGNMIQEAKSSEIFSVRIAGDYYVNSGKGMMKVIASEGDVYITESVEIDVVQLNSTGGAYGASSASSATTAFSSLESIGTGVSGVNHMELKNSRDDGKTLPLIMKKYIVIPGCTVYATRKDVSEVQGIDSKDLTAFLKENKVKWKDAQSLLGLGMFLNDRINKK